MATHALVHGPSLTQPPRESHPARTVVGCGAHAAGGIVGSLAEQTSDEARPEDPAGTPAGLTLQLPSRPDSPMTARHSLVDLEHDLQPEMMAKLRLLVTELVANSVRHARGTPIEVTVSFTANLVRTEVSDGGGGFEHRSADPSPMKTSGWGLFLVGKIAERWGADQETGTVWFEMER
jgi:anti-sigma regulatory factor (Ser/Thr protein kinase)